MPNYIDDLYMSHQEEQLRKLYYDPEKGLNSLKNLQILAKKKGITMSKKKIKEWYDRQPVNQILSGKPASSQLLSITCPFNTVGCLQADLMDVSRFKGFNRMTKFLLNVIDIHSRYAWSVPINNKQASTVAPIISEILKQVKKDYPKSIITLSTDKGSEFQGEVNTVADKLKVRRVTTLVKNNMAIVERFNRSVWELLRKLAVTTSSLAFRDVLPKIVNNYNTRVHSTTGLSPKQVYKRKKTPASSIVPQFIWDGKNIQPLVKPKIKKGDQVRVAKPKTKFEKRSFASRYSEDIYTVGDKTGNRYEVVNKNGETLDRPYLERELQLVKNVDNTKVPVLEEKIKKNNKKTRVERLNREEPAFQIDESVKKRLAPKRSKRKIRYVEEPEELPQIKYVEEPEELVRSGDQLMETLRQLEGM